MRPVKVGLVNCEPSASTVPASMLRLNVIFNVVSDGAIAETTAGAAQPLSVISLAWNAAISALVVNCENGTFVAVIVQPVVMSIALISEIGARICSAGVAVIAEVSSSKRWKPAPLEP